MQRSARVALASLASLALAVVSPVLTSTAASAGTESWQPYPEGPLTLAAARYCGGFDLRSTPVRQDVKSRVLERYDSGAIRVQEFTGVLVVEVTNLSSGATVRRNLSGHATVTFREDGSIATYEMNGPIGFGWPQQDAYDRGFYVMNGYHVVGFDASGTRTMLVDRGTEENLCDVVA